MDVKNEPDNWVIVPRKRGQRGVAQSTVVVAADDLLLIVTRGKPDAYVYLYYIATVTRLYIYILCV